MKLYHGSKQGMTMTEAFDTFYNSETHEKLNDARS